MADQKISAMTPAVTPLTGNELVPLVQSGGNVKSTLAAFGQYAINTFSNYGAFQDIDGPQTAAANTVTQLRINTVDFTQGVTKATGSNRITLTNAGVYSILISLQLANDTANYDDFTMWPAINGVAQPGSASVIAVPVTKGARNGHTILAVQYTFQFTAGQYFEFYWCNVDGNAYVLTFPESLVAPIHPSAAGVILSVIQVG